MVKSFGRNKKGSIMDLMFIGGVLLFIAITVLIGFTMMSKLNDKIQTMGDIPAKGKAASTQLTGYYPGVIDNSVLFLAIILSVGALILATLVRVHPIFIPLFIVVLAFIVLFCGVMSNIYTEMASSTELIAYANQLTVTTTIMTWLPKIILVIGGLLMIVMYKSWQSANE